jgi:flagellar biosynthesis protein FlhF
MYFKRYRSDSVQGALGRARAELGPEALVLSVSMVPRSSWRGWLGSREVEVTAAAERGGSDGRPEEVSRRPPATADKSTPDVIARLRATGLDQDLATEVANALPVWRRRAAGLSSLRGALADRLVTLAAGADEPEPIEVFVGPPGVGKTTTIAKIAAQDRARHGPRITLISADGYRVGAVEQLRQYADVIGAPFVAARSGAELDRALCTTPVPVLVDTAGRSPRDRSARELLYSLREHGGLRTHLVIAAGTKSRDVERIFDDYQFARPDRVLLTKLDETESLSPLVHVLRERRLPISYICAGQRVPEDVEPATPPVLAACVLGEVASDARAAA